MLRPAISTCGFSLTDENFARLAEAGILDVEISMGRSAYADIDYADLARISAANGISLWSYHLPFAGVKDLDIASLDEGIRKKTLAEQFEHMARAAAVGIRHFVIHPSSEPKSEDAATRREEILRSKASLVALADRAESLGADIAVEDLPRSCLGHTAAEMADIISADDRLGVCFDVNHLLYDTHAEFLRVLGKRIVTLHISDYDYVNERHWLPGEGKIDWYALYSGLHSAGYDGPWLYELGQAPTKTVSRPRDLTFADFVRNAHEIAEKLPLTVLGTPEV